MLENLITYFQVKDGCFELICEDSKSGKIITTASYPLDILLSEMKIEEKANKMHVYMHLKKINYFGTEFVIDYELCNVTIARKDIDDDGYGWADCITESGQKIKAKTIHLFDNEEIARKSAIHILEKSRSDMILFYKRLMENMEKIEQSIITKPRFVRAI